MDRMRDFSDDRDTATDVSEAYDPAIEDQGIDTPVVIGTDERRMHVRAYNHWASLLDGRAYPSVEDLHPEDGQDFAPHSVLLDFTAGSSSPSIAWLGQKLRAECDLPGEVDSIADVPPRSLLSRLTDHYLQIIANRAPVGFEAEFVNSRGHNTMYRGILMPLSSDDDTIDFIYGVINWKEVAPSPQADAIESEIAAALAAQPHRPTMPVWADGPSAAATKPRREAVTAARELPAADHEIDEAEDMLVVAGPETGLADWLTAARASAEAVRHADSRGRAALYHALGQAYDFALLTDDRVQEYADLLKSTRIVAQERAPMTPVVKLVFGAEYDKTRLTEFAAALSYAKRHALPAGGMGHFLDQYPGGLKAVVAAERRERRPADKPVKIDVAREAARALEAQAILTLPGDDEFVVLIARRIDGERVAVIGVVDGDKPMLDRALKAI
ncbi:hypothetical protein, partial [Sphingomonas sp.]|uniref:hypothetical protein n=1 Tax=Sphingomonas sp. TaxID=28214 RepID=UPI0025E663F2